MKPAHSITIGGRVLTFQEGETFTAEPGLYAPELRAGMRIENDYLVTREGVECLTDFRLEL